MAQIFYYYILTSVALILPVLTCPYALDWERKPPEERAQRSSIVVVGFVTKSFKEFADDKSTYSVEFRIIRTIKGDEIIKQLPHDTSLPDDIHRITNFGSPAQCFTDLDDKHIYMLFLQVVGQHLSAYYSDLFGAAEIWTMDMEDKVILSNLGYEIWSEWSACSETCGERGVQQRVRRCTRTSLEDCKGFNQERRRCNSLKCKDVKDVVQLGNFEQMPKGVISMNISGAMVYDITPNFYGQISAAQFFRPLWPDKFTVMGRIRPRKTKYPREGQYLFSITDSSGRLYLGLKAYPSPTLEILHSTGHHSTVSLPLPHENINDGQWHQFAFGVSGSNITMYYNCYSRTTQIIPAKAFLPNVYKSTMIIGSKMFAMDRGADERYEGALSQLVITSNPEDAKNQCEPDAVGEMVPQNPASSPRQNENINSNANYLEHWEWSAWGECSVSCGFGAKVRRPMCLDNKITLDDCIPYYVPKTHERQCYAGRCPVCECENGGSCIADDVCQCPPGWSGETCSEPICETECVNGDCVSPNKCKCEVGWSGPSCEQALCFPLCRNGGVCIGNNQCMCPKGFGGRFCTEQILNDSEDCKKNCLNGGTCIDDKCQCPEGWRGSRCHKTAPVCPGGCANGGKCRKGNVCKCKKGFSGRNCESDVCGNCRNGGKCDRRSKQCKCRDGFAGQICQYEVNENLCARNPCQNVGKCIAYDTCYCPPGWLGQRCEYKSCIKYKINWTTEVVKVRKQTHKLVDCNTTPHGKCREEDGYEFVDKPVLKPTPDYSMCEDDNS